jgi:SAM-dependent methyltransferase
MAHDAQRVFVNAVKSAYPDHFTNTRVVEMGSLDINGTVRDFFTDPIWYVGIDVGPGPGVDVVANGKDYDHDGDYFDVAISAECFEHNPDWRETFLNMKRLVKPGGLVIFTCAGKDRPEHGTSRSDVGSSPLTVEIGWEYYRNLEASDFHEHDLVGLDYQFYYEPYAKDLYFVGRKDAPLNEIERGEHWQL